MTVIYPHQFHTRITSGSYSDNFARKVIERVHQISTKPSWVTSCATLNREVTKLEEHGWKVHFLVIPGMKQVLFHHHQVHPVPNRLLTLSEAIAAQRVLDWNKYATQKGDK